MDGQKTVITFKGFNKELNCHDFQYEVGKEYIIRNGKFE